MPKRPRWKLHVEGLGKIREADVEIHPLMLFVGDNDSGKSYLASLLWGLLALHGELEPPAGPVLQECEAWFRAKLRKHSAGEEFTLTDEDRTLFLGLFVQSVSASQSILVRRVFNSELAGISGLQFQPAPVNGSPLRVAFSGENANSAMIHFMSDPSYAPMSADWTGLAMYIATYLALYPLGDRIGLNELRISGTPVFLPASRTGFMLLYKALVRRQLRQFEMLDERELRMHLTTPASRFIEMLALRLTDQIGPYAEEADFLEEALKGRVERSSVAGVVVNEYHFRVPFISSI